MDSDSMEAIYPLQAQVRDLEMISRRRKELLEEAFIHIDRLYDVMLTGDDAGITDAVERLNEWMQEYLEKERPKE